MISQGIKGLRNLWRTRLKNKLGDIPYCGVRKEVIDKATPELDLDELKIHHLYLTERHEIYKKKEILKLPQDQWTQDEVFKKYRFTNVRRELDRESIWLINNISENENLSQKDKILNTILFRTFNKSETSKLIDMPIKNFEDIDLDQYKKIFIDKKYQDPNYVFFTPAFMTGGLKKGNAFKVPPYVRRVATIINPDGSLQEPQEYIKARDFVNANDGYDIVEWEKNIPTRMLRFVQRECNEGIVEDILNCNTQEEVYERLCGVSGFGHFLAYQIFVDFTYISEFKFSENEFSVAGPGAESGLDLIFKDRDGMTYDECMFWLRDNIEKIWGENNLEYYPQQLFDHLPEYDRCYNVMMIENSLCELSKLSRAKHGTGRPRSTYKQTDNQHIKKEVEPIEKNSLF